MSASRHFFAFILAALALLTAACADNSTQSAELPTLMVLPSLTPTLTHTPSPTPTNTLEPTATNTSTPTPTPSSTATNTPTPTITPTVAASQTPTASPTQTSAAQIISTVPPIGATAAQPTVEGLQILAFTSNVPTTSPGQTITLSWAAVGDSARIETVNAQGIVITQIAVPLNGTQPFVVPQVQGTSVIYRLVVVKGDQERSQILTVGLALVCPVPWFFPNPQPAFGCPSSPPQAVPGAFQQFEGGVMLLTNLNGTVTIYALANQGAAGGFVQQNTYATTRSAWDGVTDHCTDTPPAGQFEPTGHFGWMACTQFGVAGFWLNTLGWASVPQDGSNRTIQVGADGSIVIDSPSGIIYRLQALQPGQAYGTWQRVN